jgi:hypothetical protein
MKSTGHFQKASIFKFQLIPITVMTHSTHETVFQLCALMHSRGYKYACLDNRDVTINTNVSESLCLSETPGNAYVFFQLPILCSKLLSGSPTHGDLERITFVKDIFKDKIINLNDTSLKGYIYKDDDMDMNSEPILKYYWRGIAAKLNVYGVSFDDLSQSNDCLLQGKTISIWNGIVLQHIKNVSLHEETCYTETSGSTSDFVSDKTNA